MSMNDDPRGFRRGPANRDNSQQQRGQTQQPRDRYDQYPPQGDPRASRLPPERPQPSFSAYKPEAYAKGDPQAPANGDWDRQPPQRPAPRQQRPDMAPPQAQRPEPPMSDPYSMPGDLPNDPYYQPAASDPYAARNQGGFVNNWNNDDFGGAPNQFQNFYQDDHPGFDGDPQSVHDEFFSGADIPPPPVPSNHAFQAGGFDHGHDDPYADQNLFGSEDDAFGAAQPKQRSRAPQQPPRGPQGFDDQDFYDWDEFEQGPAPAAARPFHPPAVREEDVDADYFADEDDFDIEEYENSGGGKKKLLAAVLAGAIVVGGGGAYLYSSGQGNFSAGDAPSIIAADDSPIKEQPVDPEGRDFPNGNKLIYDRLGGDGSAPQQASASGQGEPAQVAAAIPGLVASNGPGTLEERIENALRAQGGEGGQQPGSADTPRAVQTLTFGPDGSQQPAQPQTQTVSADDGASNPLSSSIVVSTQPSSAPTAPSPITSSVNAQPAAEQQPQVETRLAAANPQADAVAIAGGGSDAYFVQIGARNDPDAASEAFKTLQQRYASVIGNYSPSLRKADLGPKGVWYRLWVGPVDNKVEAEALCEQLKQAGMQACLVRKDQ
jgi:cell division septation protein DedD